jgi:hypothetical protein
MFAPIIYGYLKEAVGISTFVIFLSISLAVMILFLIYFVALIKKEGRYNKTV